MECGVRNRARDRIPRKMEGVWIELRSNITSYYTYQANRDRIANVLNFAVSIFASQPSGFFAPHAAQDCLPVHGVQSLIKFVGGKWKLRSCGSARSGSERRWLGLSSRDHKYIKLGTSSTEDVPSSVCLHLLLTSFACQRNHGSFSAREAGGHFKRPFSGTVPRTIRVG